METGPLSRVSMVAPVVPDAVQESLGLTRQLVTAIRGLNRPEFLERGREWQLRRGAAGKRPIVDLVDLETGEVLDELSPEEVFRMMAGLEKERGAEL
jgi:hypothetical protein